MNFKYAVLTLIIVMGVTALGFSGFFYLQQSSVVDTGTDTQTAYRLARLEQTLSQLQMESPINADDNSENISAQLDQLLQKFNAFDQRLSVIENQTTREATLPQTNLSAEKEHSDSTLYDNDENPGHETEASIRNREYLASLDQIIMTEGVDETRSIEVSTNLNNVVIRKPLWTEGAKIGATECSLSLCRTQVTFSRELQLDPTAAFELEHSLIMTFAAEEARGKMTRTHLADGSQQLTMYLTQSGNEFPPMPETSATH